MWARSQGRRFAKRPCYDLLKSTETRRKQKKKGVKWLPSFRASCRIRTNDPEITNHVLWPTELKRRVGKLTASRRYNQLPLLRSSPGGFEGSWPYSTYPCRFLVFALQSYKHFLIWQKGKCYFFALRLWGGWKCFLPFRRSVQYERSENLLRARHALRRELISHLQSLRSVCLKI